MLMQGQVYLALWCTRMAAEANKGPLPVQKALLPGGANTS